MADLIAVTDRWDAVAGKINANGGLLNQRALRNWRRDKERLLAGDTLKFNMGFIGDSWLQKPDRGLARIATALQAKYGNGGGGYASFSWPTTNTSYKYATPYTSLYPLTVAGAWTSNHFNQNFPDMGRIYSSSAGDRVTLGFPAGLASARLFGGANGAAIRYSWDDGSTWASLTLSVTQNALDGLPSVSGSIIIEVVSGTVQLSGIYFLASASGVVINKMAASGGRASQFAAINAANWQAVVDDLNIDLYAIMLSANDKGADTPPDVFSPYVQTIITNCRTASAASASGSKIPDILLIAQPETQSGLADLYPQEAYTRELIKLAVANDCALLDLQPTFGANPTTDYGYNAGLNLLDIDFTHVNTGRGAYAVAGAILDVLL